MTFFERMTNFNSTQWWFEVLDILLVFFLLFQLYKFVRGTAAIRIFFGVVSIYFIWKLVGYLKMKLLSEILGQFIGVGVIALVVVFQQEIRKFLLIIASPKFYNRFLLTKWLFKLKRNGEDSGTIEKEPILRACENLAKQKIGALIVITNEKELDAYKSLGEMINADLSALLLESIFQKDSPLHDGAVLITDNRIVAARCILPVSYRLDLPEHLGLRHRAAIGVTENSDAIAIVVSEQNGRLSVCKSGKLKNNVSVKRMSELINFLPY